MVRKAVLDDVQAIHRIIDAFASKGVMLHRPVSEICDSIRDFFVYENDSGVVATCALHVCSPELAEIRSLAVTRNFTNRGIGTALVKACLEEAASLGIKKVFALTYRPAFFHRCGFRTVNKDVLPHKIWSDCIRCVKFPNCDEIAVMAEVK